MDLAALALTFGTIFLVELPDKTFLATLVLSTKYRPFLVWVGVGLAFAVQTLVAVGLGHAASLLPKDVVQTVVVVMFVFGAVMLLREARDAQSDDGSEFAEKAKDVHGAKQILASFTVLFAAEWGDLSQLLTISLVAKYHAPASVFVGALGALLVVSGLAVVAGRALTKRISLHVLMYAGAAICALLAVLTGWELLT